MQQSPADEYSKLTRSPEDAIQQSTTSPLQFIRMSHNPKFVVTPESMGMTLPSSTREQQLQHEPPLVDVKSYNERHNKTSMGIEPGGKHESKISFYSSNSNMGANSYTSIKTDSLCQQLSYLPNSKTEFMTQSPSPSISPKTPSQQWNFEPSMNNYPTVDKYFVRTLSSQLSTGPNATSHTHYANLQNITSLPEIPKLYCEQQLQKQRSASDVYGDDSARMNFETLNKMYIERIEDIDENAWGDKDLKIFTYKEWVGVLTKINQDFIKNMEDLEREVAARLELVQRKVNSNCRHSQDNELMKYRKDVFTLVKCIRDARISNKLDLQGVTFETISPDMLLDLSEFDNLTMEDNGGVEIKNCNDVDVVQKNKLYANMKALAHEVADKHDEVRELKRQVICLEDEIQKAQKKIQLKDDVIKELRNDLKSAQSKVSCNPPTDLSLTMTTITFENQTCRSENTQITGNTPTSQIDNGCQFDSLSHTEHEEQQKIKLLDEEINDFFVINDDLNKQKTEYQRKNIKVIEKLESEKAEAYRKLDYIRRQLIDLQSGFPEGNNDCDSGFHSKSENDQDAKILDAVRKRLRSLNENNCELKKRLQKLTVENAELLNSSQTAKSFSERNGNILKQIADLLCDLKGKIFSYTEIYSPGTIQENPFCEAIMEMQREFEEKEKQMLKALGMKNQQNEELTQLLLQNEKNFNAERTLRLEHKTLEDIDYTSAALPSTSSQPTNVGTSVHTVPPHPQPPSTLSTSLTGHELDTKTAASLLTL